MKTYACLLLLACGTHLGVAQVATPAPPASAALPPAGLLVISHVNVVNVVEERILEDRMVVVRDGRIEYIGPRANRRAPAGRAVQRLNGRGKYLVPGLWDARVRALSSAAEERLTLPLYVAHGVTTIRDVSTSRSRAELLATVHAVEAGERVGPRIELAGPVVDGATVPPATSAPALTQAQALDLLQQGWRRLQTGPLLSPEAYQDLVDVTQAWRVPLTGRLPEALPVLSAVFLGQRGVEPAAKLLLGCSSRENELVAARARCLAAANPAAALAALSRRQQPEIVRSFNGKLCSLLGQTLAQNRTFVVPTLRVGPGTPGHDLPYAEASYRFIPATVRQQWEQTELQQRPRTAADYVMARALDSLQSGMVLEFRRQGVAVLAGSGTGWATPYSYPGSSLLDELDHLVAAGLSPLEALQSATLFPAIATGHRYDSGQIAPDFRADLVLLDANPLDDIRNLRRVRAVVLRGRVLPPTFLAGLKATAEQAARQVERAGPAAAAR